MPSARDTARGQDDTRGPADDPGNAPFNLQTAPGHLLRRNDQRAYEIFQKHVGNTIRRQQFAVLNALRETPGASQKDLVEATGIDKSTAMEMLGRMVARHWVFRRRAPQDSRAWQLLLTDEGQRVLSAHLEAGRAAQQEILDPLLPDEREVFVALLRKLLGLPPAAPGVFCQAASAEQTYCRQGS